MIEKIKLIFALLREIFIKKLKKLLGKNTVFSNSSTTNPLLIAGLFLKRMQK